MSRLKALLARLRALRDSDAVHREIDEELQFHIDMRAEENVRRGMTPAEARRAAEERFGHRLRIKEMSYGVRGGGWLETLWQDLRYAARTLRTRPGFAAVAVLTLALGIGANTAIFSVVNAVLLRPLPYEDPERIVRIGGTNQRRGAALGSFSPQDFFDWRERANVFEALAAYDGWSPSLTGAGEPERVEAARVSPGFFGVLKVSPALGRDFLPAEEQRGNHLSVILSHPFWQRRFGGDPRVIGRSLTLNGHGYTVVGIMPAGFAGPKFTGGDFEQAELWAPFAPDLSQWTRDGRSVDAAIARLKPGVSLAQAQAELDAIAAQLQRQYPDTNAGIGAAAASLHEQAVGAIRPALLTFLVAVGLVLLIACANVANLLLARAAARQKEIAVRMALGAGRARIVRQLLTESVLLAGLGGAAGLLLALWATSLLVALGSDAIPRPDEIAVDARVLGFTLGVSLLTGIAFGLAPALAASRPDLNETLKEGGRSQTFGRGRKRVRGVLVVSEVALSLLLLIGAGLLVKSFVRLRRVDPGFDPRHVLTMNAFLPGARYPEEWQHAAFFEKVLERVRALPGVESASVVSNLPVSGNYDRISLYVEGQTPAAREDIPDAERYMVDAEYFKTMRIPLLGGRPFNDRDTAEAPPVVIVNESVARRFWPGESAVGKRVRTDPSRPWLTVVGVVGEVRHYSLEAAPNMQLYLPHRQVPSQVMTFAVRSAGDPGAQAAAVRGQVWAVDKDQPVYDVRTMGQLLSESLAQRRFTMLLVGVFAGVALLLAAVGLYGVMNYAVAQRTHEIGIRMALGAQRGDVLRIMLGQGMALTLGGVGLGLVAAAGLTRVLESLLYGVSALDPAVFAGVTFILIAVAFLACCIPARKATRVDPIVALRYE
ncbi:MAG: ABC transporter permease [Acidobacteriota bacterium]|nr:ABC transporter permease [Acidobacteriota bacterium]